MICQFSIFFLIYFLENKDLTEPLLLTSKEEDELEMGVEAHSSFLKHLKEIRKHAESEFGWENISFRGWGSGYYDQSKHQTLWTEIIKMSKWVKMFVKIIIISFSSLPYIFFQACRLFRIANEAKAFTHKTAAEAWAHTEMALLGNYNFLILYYLSF